MTFIKGKVFVKPRSVQCTILKLLFAALLVYGANASAAAIKVLSAMALRSVMEQLLPEFERVSGHRVVIEYETANIMANRVRGGEAADLAILTPSLLDELAKFGRIAAGSNVTLARSGVGIAVRAGALRPDISSPAALKQTLLDAKSIAYTSSGQSGTYFAGLIERLGIVAEVRAKAKIPAGGSTGELVVGNEVEMAVQQLPELLAIPGLEVVPLPPELQNMTAFAAGVCTGAQQPAAAQALISFLLTPDAARVIQAKGMEPG
jgi:molybdate transport system substrate-binding protein